MKHYAMARKEIFEAAAVKPSGSMPEGASPPAEKGEAETEADAKQNPKQQATAASGADEQEQKKSPQNTGSLQDDAARLHSEQSGVMGDTEFESVTSSMSTRRSNQLSQSPDLCFGSSCIGLDLGLGQSLTFDDALGSLCWS